MRSCRAPGAGASDGGWQQGGRAHGHSASRHRRRGLRRAQRRLHADEAGHHPPRARGAGSCGRARQGRRGGRVLPGHGCIRLHFDLRRRVRPVQGAGTAAGAVADEIRPLPQWALGDDDAGAIAVERCAAPAYGHHHGIRVTRGHAFGLQGDAADASAVGLLEFRQRQPPRRDRRR